MGAGRPKAAPMETPRPTTDDAWMARLDAEQRAVAAHREGPLHVQAVAGSGKTTAVVARIVELIRAGVPPMRILAMTFSRDAANEMNVRLTRTLGATAARVGTFHSVGFEILRWHKKGAQLDVDQGGRYKVAIKKSLTALHWDFGDVSVVTEYISRCKGDLIEPGTPDALARAARIEAECGGAPYAEAEKLYFTYAAAEQRRKKDGYITFDDMLYEAGLLLQDEAVRLQWAQLYDYVIQDEAQDQNRAQSFLAECFAKDHRNYMQVGDVSQTIYRWRGAQPELLSTFGERWNATVLPLRNNYRSVPAICHLGNRILALIPGADPAIRIQPARSQPDGAGPVLETFSDGISEAKWIGDQIHMMLAAGTHRPDDIAILLRIGAHSLYFEEALYELKVSYHLAVGRSFFDRQEVATLLSYLRLIDGSWTPSDITATLKRPTKYLTNSLISIVEAAAVQYWGVRGEGALTAATEASDRLDTSKSWLDLVRDLERRGAVDARCRMELRQWARLIDERVGDIKRFEPVPCSNGEFSKTCPGCSLCELDPAPQLRADPPSEILSEILEATGYIEWLRREEGTHDPDDEREANVMALRQRARRFETIGELLRHADEIKQLAKVKHVAGKVTITTCHRAKGLEWRTVFVPMMNAGVFPHSKAPVEDELRLFYVACTRAKDELIVSTSDYREGDESSRPSPFLYLTNLLRYPQKQGHDSQVDEHDVVSVLGVVPKSTPKAAPQPLEATNVVMMPAAGWWFATDFDTQELAGGFWTAVHAIAPTEAELLEKLGGDEPWAPVGPLTVHGATHFSVIGGRLMHQVLGRDGHMLECCRRAANEELQAAQDRVDDWPEPH